MKKPKKRKHKSGCDAAIKTPISECQPAGDINHSFKGGKYYRDDRYIGNIISIESEGLVKVECKSDNKYLNGRIIEMYVDINKYFS